MKNIEIRKAVKADAPTIIDFQLKMAKETEDLELEKDTLSKGTEAVFNNDFADYFVAVSNGEIVASLMITYEWSDWRNAMVSWIQSVFVIKEFRRKGVFAKMYNFVKDQVSNKQGFSGIRLYVDKSNKNAIATYKDMGMDNQHYEMFEYFE